MPDEAKKTILSSIPLPGALAVLTALAGAVLLNYEPLVPRRPVTSAASSVVPGDTHKFDAAPGEDPLRALARARLVPSKVEDFDPSSEVRVHTPEEFFGELQERLEKMTLSQKRLVVTEPQTVLLVPVLLRPGMDLASIEHRGRARAAVTAGLISSGYVPEHGGSLECCRVSPWPPGPPPAPRQLLDSALQSIGVTAQEGTPRNGRDSQSLDLVFEWFKSSTRIAMAKYPEHPAVGVLWVRADALGSRPLTSMRRILQRLLREPLPDTAAPHDKRLEVLMLGPHSTDSLASFVREAADAGLAAGGQSMEMRAQVRPLRLYSPWATASAHALIRLSEARPAEVDEEEKILVAAVDQALATQAPEEQIMAAKHTLADKRTLMAEQRVEQLMKSLLDPAGRYASPFLRSVTTDDYVADALVDELGRRGLPLRTASSASKDQRKKEQEIGHVAIVSEFDTSYGRELPLAFMEATMTGEDLQTASRDMMLKFNQQDSRWHWINYPRGLDGRFGGDTGVASSDKASSGGRGEAQYAPDEVPIGVNQADALRRLAAQLEELDARLTRGGGAGLRAVGVLGGDVYDKLWILRALRPRLPRTQFFTNNLDAWLWQRDELRTTRNLIVASPYGVALAAPFQMGKLPFRDSYQTSVYAATLAATEVVHPAHILALRSVKAVRLFEIGRSEAHNLSLTSPQVALHPPVESNRWWQHDSRSLQTWAIGIMVLLLWLGWLAFSGLPGLGMAPTWQSMAARWKPTAVEIAKSPAIVFILAAFVFWRIESWWSGQREGGEPLLFTAGISAWPAEACRLMAVLLTLHLTFKACVMLAGSTRQLRSNYFPDSVDPAQSRVRRSPREWFKSMCLFWNTSSMLTARQGEESIVHPSHLWSEYRHSNSITARLTRSFVVALLLFGCSSLLLNLFGTTFPPVRGPGAREIDLWLDRASLAALLWLVAFVVDMLWLNRVFIQWFSRGRSDWSEEMLRAHRVSGLHADNLRDYVDLQMVADWTRDIGRFAFFPFYVLGLLIVARVDRFDAWSWSPALILIYFLVVVIIVVGVARVRGAAENLRRKAVADVLQRYTVLSAHEAATRLLTEIGGLRRGAFVPFSEQPVMKALYWLLGALGVGGLWQAFAQWL